MDIAFFMRSRRLWTLIVAPLTTWVLMQWPVASKVAGYACTAITYANEAEKVCSASEAQTFAITNITLGALALVALLLKHRQLTLTPKKKPEPEPNSGDQGGMPATPKGK
jgi:hypothetical protein